MEEANSEDTESFHNWSTSSRWLVLSSRRDDGRKASRIINDEYRKNFGVRKETASE